MSSGVLAANEVKTITLARRINNVTVTTDSDEIWFTTDGRNPDYQRDVAHRVPFGGSRTVPVTGQADPTVIKLRSTGTPGYTVVDADPPDVVTTAVDTAVAALVASAPAALDTLNELAAALGDDANFASTVTTALAGKSDTTHDHDADIAAAALVVGNRQTASYIYALADLGKEVEMDVAGANALTIPPNADVAFPVGAVLVGCQWGAGQTTITPGAGVTLHSSGGKLLTSAQYACFTARQVAADEWLISGDLAA